MIQLLGAAAFGAIIGWYVYYINRYRKGDVQFSDLTTLVGVLGGAGVTQLFGGGDKALFGAYGIGLFLGFFSYLLVLTWLVHKSANFTSDWFLDGRRTDPVPPVQIPGDARTSITAMDPMPAPAPAPTVVIHTATPAGVALEADVAPSGMADRIIECCEAEFDIHKADCSGFAKAVAGRFQVQLNGLANDIVDQIQGAGWTVLGSGIAAKAEADAGKLVIAALKGSDTIPPESHGHVVVVVSGPLAHGKYPSAYWGRLNGVGRKNTTLNYAWKAVDRDRIIYAAHAV